ncbi:MAG: dCMP deaminase family protein [Bacteroidales bacterium]|nr:dCMP deaminase family protein [Bacteroidales bacterium]
MKNRDDKYMAMAEIWSTNSYAVRAKVGALIVKDSSIIADGFNGTPSGFDNCCEEMVNGELVTKKCVLHAEANAITKLAKSTQSSVGATLYVTMCPCMECSKLIVQAGIRRVVYGKAYRDLSGVNLLKEAGIEVVQYGEE